MTILQKVALATLLIAPGSFIHASSPGNQFWLGADISHTTELESKGIITINADGDTVETTRLMRDLGLNAIRLRVWVNPAERWSSKEDVLDMARRVQDQGMALMVDFHYSDWWADPSHQNIPKAWADMNMDQLKQALTDHTVQTLQLLKDNNIDVEWVQVGNETTNGMMWPVADIKDHMDNYAELTNVGYDAVKSVYPNATVIVHLDNGYDSELYNRVFDALRERGCRWDMIGMSLYPYWTKQMHPEMTDQQLVDLCVNNIKALHKKYNTRLMLVETGVQAEQPHEGKAFLSKLIDAMANGTDGICEGVFYWEPELTPESGYALGAFQNSRPTEIMDAFTEAAHWLNRPWNQLTSTPSLSNR